MLKRSHVVIAGGVALLSACAGSPERNSVLEEARSAYTSARNDPRIAQYAPDALNKAREELAAAEQLFDQRAGEVPVTHHAYLSKQHTAIARESTQIQLAEQAIKKASGERERLVAQARIDEAKTSTEKAQAAREAAEAKARDAIASQQQLAEQMQTAEAERQAAIQRQREAEIAQQQAAAKARIDELTAELQAKQTERGLVLTLSNVLFDVDGSQLKPGAMPTVSKLAQFLREYPQRKVLVEGFTDSTGSGTYNQQLSEQRANAVRDALRSLGIEENRIDVRGYGESRPVANNETAAGRQQNRRVEVVITEGGTAGRAGAPMERK